MEGEEEAAETEAGGKEGDGWVYNQRFVLGREKREGREEQEGSE